MCVLVSLKGICLTFAPLVLKGICHYCIGGLSKWRVGHLGFNPLTRLDLLGELITRSLRLLGKHPTKGITSTPLT